MRSTLVGLVWMMYMGVALSQVPGIQEGVVSYRNPQNVYVKFNNTAQISAGDTLFVLRNNTLVPALVVTNTSSISVVGVPLSGVTLDVKDTVISRSRITPDPAEPGQPDIAEEELPVPAEVPVVPIPEGVEISRAPVLRETIRGRLSASFYSNVFSEARTIQRMRYTFSLQAQHIQGSRISAETFISFRHQLDDWKAIHNTRSKALRVYSLAVRYDVNDRTALTLGRKVNTRMANIGAIDGLQVEHAVGRFILGGFAGARPDHTDFGLNTQLLQFGAFAAHRVKAKHGAIQNSLALAEQRNNGMTDRRFAYIQHSSNLTKTISLFGSFEFDLYQRIDTTPESKFDLTSLYVSLQYRPNRRITLSGSYDARRNVIFYETFRNFIDELIEQETRQGLRFRVHYRPVKFLSLGSAFGYRFQKTQGNDAMHMNFYATHSRLPWVHASLTVSATVIENPYLQGLVYGVRMSRDVIKQKLFGEIEYRRVNYAYGQSEISLEQDLIGLNLSWRIRKKLSLGVDYEGQFQSQNVTHRVHLNLIQRF